MKVSVIGTGYVGLVSGVCLAEKGHSVICVDIDPAKVDMINAAQPPIYEAGLEALLKKNTGSRLKASTDLRTAVLESDISLIAVGTPFDGDRIDLKYIRQVAQEIGEVLRDKPTFHAVIVKSTVVPGTTDGVVAPILAKASGRTPSVDFGVGMNPEFLKEGDAIEDFMNPDRVVLGGMDDRTVDMLAELYSVFEGVDLVRCDTRTAEMIKYTANSLLATLISFSNEIGNLCSMMGVDTVDAMHGMHLDKRFMPILEDGTRVRPGMISYLASGCGFGGSCFPKDVKALIAHGESVGHDMSLLKAVIDVNKRQPARMIDLLRQHYPDLSGTHITVLGVAFKPGTDDVRESPAIPIITDLLRARAVVTVYDPPAQHEAYEIFEDDVTYAETLEAAICEAKAVMLVTHWPEFADLPARFANLAPAPLLIDGRRNLPKNSFERYEGIGLQPQPAAELEAAD